jgi:hypothetical protein
MVMRIAYPPSHILIQAHTFLLLSSSLVPNTYPIRQIISQIPMMHLHAEYLFVLPYDHNVMKFWVDVKGS